jgi:4-amino-4-deoxy-L-arabinose transferase-like glycosyltransferase
VIAAAVHIPRPALSARRGSSLLLPLLSLALGVIYAWIVTPGLPYDEPSHWSTVLYYANHHRLPVLGDPGVTYEAQMGPVAYIVDAFVVDLAQAAGLSASVRFHLVRLVGAAELCTAVVLVAMLMRRFLHGSWLRAAAVAIFALNPMLLTMSSSVQNDTLALVLGFLALELALGRLSDQPAFRSALLVGIIAGVAILTKLTAWPVVLAIAGWLVWRHRRDALRPLAAFVVAVLAISGWWFVRNIVLYGDPTAAAAVHRTGVSFAPYRVHGASGIVHVVEELVTYLWLPTEYVRHFISAPTAFRAGLFVATTVVLLAGSIGIRVWRQVPRWLIISTAVFSIASWLVTHLAYQAIAPRVAYMFLPLWIGLVGLALSRVPRPAAIVGVTLLLVCLNAWTLYELSRVHSPEFIRL